MLLIRGGEGCIICCDPCKEAKEAGLNGTSGGGVICCNGIKYSCVWAKNNIYGVGARSIIIKCTKVHEDAHHDAVTCNGNHLHRPGANPDVDINKEEADAYKKELECLKESIKDCLNITDCIQNIKDEMDFVNKLIKEFGG